MRLQRLMILPVVAVLLCTGCYTKFYRPDMERAPRESEDVLYNRYDSTAIDTTLVREESYPDNDPYDQWSYWGYVRPRTRWGFDFYSFTPDYYWSYYGFYDYYGVPWWHNWWYDDYWRWRRYPPPPPGRPVPAEPPSRRHGRRGDSGGSGSSSVEAPPPQPNPPAHVQPQPPANPPQQGGQEPKKEDAKRRSGRRGG